MVTDINLNGPPGQEDPIPSTKADRYISYGLNSFNMGVADDGRSYVFLKEENNSIAHPLNGAWLKRWIRQRARRHGEIITSDDMKDILDNIEGHAAISDERIKVHLRVGRSDEGYPEMDLGTEDQARVRFKDGNAELILEGSSTLFSRPDTMLPLPVPSEQGDWRALLPFLNMSDEHRLLTIGWMSWCMCHERFSLPYPLMVLQGPQGMGKSFLCKHIFRRLMDNNAAGIQVYRGQVKEMAISASHQYLLIYDNVRLLTRRQSDDFCVFSTSGTLSGRKLYTDDGQSLLMVHCAIVLNGIHHFVVEPDLASRSVIIHLLPLDEKHRVEEEQLATDLEAKLPCILRGLIDLCAQALHTVHSVEVTHPERMLSFCRWLAALEQVMGLPTGRLQKAYSDNLKNAAMESVQESALGVTALRFTMGLPNHHWVGTPSQLLIELENLAPNNTTYRHTEWPQSPISLSKRLKQIGPLLKAQGVELAFSHGTSRQIEITYTPPESAQTIDLIEEPDESTNPRTGQSGLSACTPKQNQSQEQS
jgi:hypothetical protein